MKLSTEQIELAEKLIKSGVAKGIVSQMMGVDRTTLRRNLQCYNKSTNQGGD